ncbi:hypothetical protein ACDX78_18295 [Virgibacillus oceani]
MKDREKTKLDQSLKSMDEHITWDEERQQHSRKMLLSKLEQDESPKRKPWIRRHVAPVLASVLFLGTAGTLIVSEFSEQEQINEQQNEQQINMAGNTSHGFEIAMDEKAEADVREINESGFALQLPQYSPVENTDLENIFHRSKGQNDVVTASYYDGGGNKLFTFMQESILEHTDITHLQEKADYETEIKGNVTFVSENDNSGLRTINMIVDNYGFTLSTYNLTEEQLLTIGESIIGGI